MDDYTPKDNTTFYVESVPSRLSKFAWLIAIAGLIIGAIAIWAGIGSGARSALSHAKDIRVALKLISLEYYGGDGSIYEPSSENGMPKEALEKLKSIVPVRGDLQLTGWDYANNIPVSFSYREGRYLVEYKDLGQGDGTYGMNGDWSVYYDFKVLEYTAGE